MSYDNGRIFHGGSDGNMRCWDIKTGELMWTYNPESWYGLWAASSGAATEWSMNTTKTHTYTQSPNNWPISMESKRTRHRILKHALNRRRKSLRANG
jgi:outer membrane protein assembly factor BamB